jgi:hypothetical protein
MQRCFRSATSHDLFWLFPFLEDKPNEVVESLGAQNKGGTMYAFASSHHAPIIYQRLHPSKRATDCSTSARCTVSKRRQEASIGCK